MSDHEGEIEYSTPSTSQVIQVRVNLMLPSPLSMIGDFSKSWKRFKRAWNSNEIAARLKDPSNPQANKELRTATLLTFIESDARDVYDGFEWIL